MIFVGDIAIPCGDDTTLKGVPEELKKDIVANLEGCITVDEPENAMSVYNSDRVLTFLKENGVKAVSLANNHILDEKTSFDDTRKKLADNGILSFGAGWDDASAREPVKILSEGSEYYLLGYAWEVTGIHQEKKGIHISLLKKKKMLEDIRKIKERDDSAQIICFLHWGYELEEYPLPKDRELAREVIDAGACAVIGCHSHCVQGIELYKEKPIVYGLGNFFFPEGKYLGGKLKYPEFAHKEMAFEIKDGEYRCHWFQYHREGKRVEYLESTDIDAPQIKQRTSFDGMEHREYIKWFKINRRKKKLLPVFSSSGEGIQDYLSRTWCRLRGNLIKTLFRLGLKGGPV